jgi:hypothetical protein
MTCVKPPVPHLQRVIILPIPNPIAVCGMSMDSMCQRFIQHTVFQLLNAAGRAGIAGQAKTREGGLIGIRGHG